MKNYKTILSILGSFILSMIIYLLIITLFAYFNVFSYKVVSVFSFIFMCIIFLISGIRLGKVSEKRGFVSGILIGGILILLMLILALIFRSFPGVKSLIYFAILLISSTLGGMIGINKRKR